MAQWVAFRACRIRDRLNRVYNLPRVCAIGSSPDVDVAASIHEHDARVRACVDDAVPRAPWAQPCRHGAESASCAAVRDVVRVDDDNIAADFVRNARLERYCLRLR